MMVNTPPKKNRFKRQNVEFQLRERERFLRTLISNLPGVVFRCRADEYFTKEFLSDGCLKLTGYRPEMLIGADATRTWSDLVHPDDRERIESELHHLVKENEPPLDSPQFKITYRIITCDEQIKQVRERFEFVRDSSGKIIALEGFINDITERTVAKERVRDSEARYRLLAENMRDLVCLHELDGKWCYVSPSSVAMLGYPPDELIGMSPALLIHPEDQERVRDEAYEPLLSGEADSLVIELRMHDKKGDYYWFETMAQTVRNPNGEIVQLQTVSRDITKRKEAEAEREKTQEELARLLFSEKEARQEAEAARVEVEHASRVKDEFLQMVSHEFRTPLTTIKTLVRVLQHEEGGTKAARGEHLETIASECDRQVDMILNLLDVSRLEEGDVDLKREPVDINRILQSCEKIERPAADARRQIFNIEHRNQLPPVCGDEKAIRRALCTVIENAIKYTPETGMINISPRHITRLKAKLYDESDRVIAAKLFGDLPKQMDFSDGGTPVVEEIAVVICDTGRGILPEDVPRIFQKFFRGAKPFADTSTDGTPDDAAGKAETPGVGLGLYLAKRLITALEGRISVNSEPGRGSCFTVFLPVWNESASERDAIDEYNFDEEGVEQ